MTDSLESMDSLSTEQQELAAELVARARDEGVELTGPDGLLTVLTKRVLQTALEAEISDHLGHDKHDPAGRDRSNSRNGTVLTDIGQVEAPRDREASCEPQTVRKPQCRLSGVNEIALSLTTRGMTTGEISSHFSEVDGAPISKDTVSAITDTVLEEMTEWCHRPLDRVYPVVFVDAIAVKVRNGQVTDKPVYVAIGVTVDRERDILGLWIGDGGEGAKFWLQVFTELKNRGVEDICILVSDGLNGMADSMAIAWPLCTVQTCVIHLIRNTFRYAARQGRDKLSHDLRLAYTAPTETAAQAPENPTLPRATGHRIHMYNDCCTNYNDCCSLLAAAASRPESARKRSSHEPHQDPGDRRDRQRRRQRRRPAARNRL